MVSRNVLLFSVCSFYSTAALSFFHWKSYIVHRERIIPWEKKKQPSDLKIEQEVNV